MTVNTSKSKSVQNYLMRLSCVRPKPLSTRLLLEHLQLNSDGQPMENNRSHQIVIDKASLNISVIHFNFKIFGVFCITNHKSFPLVSFVVLNIFFLSFIILFSPHLLVNNVVLKHVNLYF